MGCYGEFRPPYSISNYGITDDSDGTDKKGLKGELCDDLTFDDITRATDGNYFVIRDDKFWTITGFPNDIVVLGSDLAQNKWPGFLTKADAFMVVEEGHLRGQAFAFRNLVYNRWTLDGLLKSESIKFEKINAVLQNSDAQNSQVIGFGEKKVRLSKCASSFPC